MFHVGDKVVHSHMHGAGVIEEHGRKGTIDGHSGMGIYVPLRPAYGDTPSCLLCRWERLLADSESVRVCSRVCAERFLNGTGMR